MPDSVYDEVVRTLSAQIASTRCSDMRQALESLGFSVKDAGRGNHKVVYHVGLSKISDFKTTDYDCGHGRNPEVRSSYVRNVLKVLRTYESELREFLGE